MSSNAVAADRGPLLPSCALLDLNLDRRQNVQQLLARNCRITPIATVAEALEQSDCVGLLIVHDPPGTDAAHAAQVARAGSRIPIIALCAQPTDCDTTLQMFTAGVDDVVLIGVDPRELVARLAAVTRRAAAGAVPATGDSLRMGDLDLDPGSHTVTLGGVRLMLTRKEFDVLRVLAGAQGRTVRRDDLARRVWRRDPRGLDHTLDSHIASLRTKLGLRNLIATVRGVGYRLEVDDESER